MRAGSGPTSKEKRKTVSPRGFSEEEQAHIRSRLIAIGRELFGRHGIRKVTVDELARRAGIAKGSFYRFFSNKEHLCLAVLKDIEQEIRALSRLEPPPGQTLRDVVRGLLREQQSVFAKYPILERLSDPSELASLVRHLPSGALEEHLEAGDRFLEALARRWAEIGVGVGRDPVAVAGLLKILNVLPLQKHLVGPSFESAHELLLELVADGLVPED
jgi:AcrR family transcriptional regulator